MRQRVLVAHQHNRPCEIRVPQFLIGAEEFSSELGDETLQVGSAGRRFQVYYSPRWGSCAIYLIGISIWVKERAGKL